MIRGDTRMEALLLLRITQKEHLVGDSEQTVLYTLRSSIWLISEKGLYLLLRITEILQHIVIGRGLSQVGIHHFIC